MRPTTAFIVFLALTAAWLHELPTSQALAAEPTTAPANARTLFEADKLTLPPTTKTELATAMATHVRNQLDLSRPANVQKAQKFLAVALTLDPKNKIGYVASAQLKQRQVPSRVADSDVDGPALIKQMLAAAETAKGSSVDADRLFAAYLYALVLEIQADHEDAIFELGMLKDGGVQPSWPQVANAADAAPASADHAPPIVDVPVSELVLALSFDKTTKSNEGGRSYVHDVSNKNKRALVQSASVINGKIGQAFQFSSSDQYVEVNHSDQLNPSRNITVAAWVKPTRERSYGTFVDKADWKGPGATRGYVLRISEGVPNFTIGSQGWQQVDAASRPAVDEWTFVAGTFNGKELKIYVNGEESATRNVDGLIEPSTYPLRIGSGTYEEARDRGFLGVIDEVAVFRQTLSDAEVAALYNLTMTRGLGAIVSALQSRAGDRKPTYLGDLPPTMVSVFQDGTWSFAGKGRLARSDGPKLSVNGIETPNGLCTAPPSNGSAKLAYKLGKQYGKFIGDVALNDSVAQSRTPLTFQILGDGRELWTSKPVQFSKQKQGFSVSVTGVDQLELLVHCPGHLHDAHAVWVEPRLYKGAVESDDSGSERVVNLLPRINPSKDAVGGAWRMTKDGLLSDAGNQTRIRVMDDPPAEYDFRTEFTRTAGDDGVYQILTAGNSSFIWCMGSWHNTSAGFQMVDGQDTTKNETSIKATAVLQNGKRHTSVVKVRKNSVSAYLDGKLLSRFTGDFSRLSIHPDHSVGPMALGLGSHESPTIFRVVELTEVSGEDGDTGTEELAEDSPPDPDAIERPQFSSTPKPVIKKQATIKSMMVRVAEDGQMLGTVADIIATVPPGQQNSSEVRFVGDVGEEMKKSIAETLRAIRLRYPQWTGGPVEMSFGEQYDKHDGGSAGTAFGMLILSLLEGVDLDPSFAVTGDLTVDWKVRKVGGLAAKVRGAQLDKCPYALIPAASAGAVSDMPLLYDDSLLWDVQVLSMATLQEGMRIVRTDRDAKLAEAMKLFGELQAKRSSSKTFLTDDQTKAALTKITELAPNHLSARHLLKMAKGEASKSLSANASLSEFFVAAYPYRDILFAGEGSLPTRAAATNARKRIAQLRPISQRQLHPLFAAFLSFVEICDRANSGRVNANDLHGRRQAVLSKLADLQANREMMEKLIREGY